ncbi:MAG: hypothetical protein U0Q12_06770 [Vicinamibacterales bacterium]
MTDQPHPFSGDTPAASAASARARHEAALMRLPNVVGIFEGTKTVPGGRVPCVVVLVSEKIARHRLAPGDVIPDSLDGVPTDVVAVGSINALT